MIDLLDVVCDMRYFEGSRAVSSRCELRSPESLGASSTPIFASVIQPPLVAAGSLACLVNVGSGLSLRQQQWLGKLPEPIAQNASNSNN
jgi:hypothetical protein